MKRNLSIVCLAAAASLTHANLLTNGGFESPGSTAFNYFQNGEVPGWTVGSGDVMEIGMASVYGVSGAEQRNMLELDSNRNVTVSQSVGSGAGQYELSFIYAKRGTNTEGRPSDTCDFQVLWNNQVVGSFSPQSTVMASQSLTLTGAVGSNLLSFRGVGSSDTFGAIIDAVELNPVPEPITLVMFGLGSVAMARRQKRNLVRS